MTQMIDINALEAIETERLPCIYRTAKLSEFRAPAPKLLFGARLKKIAELEASISAHGLMRPLKVTRSGDKYIVIDGRKRLCALRRMRFKNSLPRSLVNIPFVLSTEPVPHIMSAQDLYSDIIKLKRGGGTEPQVLSALCLTDKQYRDLMCVNCLSPRLKSAFLGGTLTLSQACAFAALPWFEAQDSLLLCVGPSATPREILAAIDKRNEGAINSQPAIDNVIQMPRLPIEDLAHFECTAPRPIAA